jgi:uncharacterized protein
VPVETGRPPGSTRTKYWGTASGFPSPIALLEVTACLELPGTHAIVNIQSQIDALETLAAADEELAKLEAELEAERLVLGDKRGQLEGLDQKLTSMTTNIGDMERLRNELTTEARQMSLQMDRSREKLARCRTEREVNAAQREVEELRKLYRDRETEIQRLAGLIDQARTDSQGLHAQRQSVSSDLGQSAGATETKMGQLDRTASGMRARREMLVKDVPPVLYRRYEMVRKRRGSGLSHTTEGTCSACHIQLNPMLFQVLRRGEGFDQCPSCQRLLYFKKPEKTESAPAGSAPAEEAASGNGT